MPRKSFTMKQEAWIVGEVRKHLNSRHALEQRLANFIKRSGRPGSHRAYRRYLELLQERKTHRHEEGRLASIQKEIEALFGRYGEELLPGETNRDRPIDRCIRVPAPGTREKGAVYRRVATASTAKFRRKVTPLMVERAVGRWLKMEAAIVKDLDGEADNNTSS